MNVQYGLEVVDRNGQVMGTVSHVLRDTWTGDIRKFVVREESSATDRILSPADVIETTEATITLSVSLDEVETIQS